MRLKIGDKIRLTNQDYDFYEAIKDRELTITHIAYSEKEHPGYDSGVGGALVDTEELDCSLYTWEFERA
jgi:hypothetical protein